MATGWNPDDLLAEIGSQKPLLDLDALRLLDWTLSSASRLSLDNNLEELLEGWKVFRSDIWEAILNIEEQIAVKKRESAQFATPGRLVAPLTITQEMATRLLALVPVTFRWGTHDDCGYPLKLKLARIERGENPNESLDGVSGAGETKDKAGDQTGDGTAA